MSFKELHTCPLLRSSVIAKPESDTTYKADPIFAARNEAHLLRAGLTQLVQYARTKVSTLDERGASRRKPAKPARRQLYDSRGTYPSAPPRGVTA